VERELPDWEIEIFDCQAQRKNWDDIEKEIEAYSPLIVATSGFTCNAYVCARVAEIAKKVNPNIVTVVGGIHFSQVPEESLTDFPEIDYIVRGEGEETLVELLKVLQNGKNVSDVKGLSFKHNGKIIHTNDRPLIENLDTLPYPAYHLVEDQIKNYHFTMMAGKDTIYMVMEGARGCSHKCTFCTQWNHWNGVWRTKSPKRIVNEIEFQRRGKALLSELKPRKFIKDVMLFFQARTDDVANNPDLVGQFRDVGNYWVMMGVENHSKERLKEYRKGISVPDAYKAVKILNESDIFSHSMFVIGSRKDTAESMEQLREFSLDLGSDFSIYTTLTPYPGTVYYDTAKDNGWIEDTNYAHYDMAHAIMPTETVSRKEVQQELWRCYRARYGSIPKNIAGVFSRKKLKRNLYRHYARQQILKKLKGLI
jgi:anaerobic magnesium-protoporphyrin IX monomethyl ester cyclase